MKQIRSLFYFLVLVVVGGAFAWGAKSFYEAPDILIPPLERVTMLILPAFFVFIFLVGWAERFLLRTGGLIGLLGSLIRLVHDMSPIGRSLQNLKLWHQLRNNEYARQQDGSDQDAGSYPPGYIEYTRGLNPLERAEFEAKNPFSQWMIADVVKRYENNVNGFAYLGAGILIFLIGLRGLGIIGREHPLPIVLSLEIEFTIIATLGLLLFYKPEESTKMTVSLDGTMPTSELKDLTQAMVTMRDEIKGDRTITLHVSRKKD